MQSFHALRTRYTTQECFRLPRVYYIGKQSGYDKETVTGIFRSVEQSRSIFTLIFSGDPERTGRRVVEKSVSNKKECVWGRGGGWEGRRGVF